MAEPPRLLDETTDSVARELLEAAREERPRQSVRARTLSAVAAGGAVLGAGKGAGAAAAGASSLWLKWVGVAVLGGAGAAAIAVPLVSDTADSALPPEQQVGVVSQSKREVVERHALVTPNDMNTAQVSGGDRSQLTPDAAAQAEAETRKRDVSATEGNVATRAEPKESLVAEPDAQLDAAQLLEETQLLDRAKSLSDRGSPQAALAVLNEYFQDHPNGTLTPEALALRMTAAEKAGDHALAKRTARAVMRAYPRGPVFERAQRISAINSEPSGN